MDTQSRGDPESPLRWTAKSVRRLRDELRTGGHRVSHETVARLLRGLGSSLQANRKGREGTAHPDRDAQFQHLNTTATRALDAGEPVISVDTKKKELVGDCKNGGDHPDSCREGLCRRCRSPTETLARGKLTSSW